MNWIFVILVYFTLVVLFSTIIFTSFSLFIYNKTNSPKWIIGILIICVSIIGSCAGLCGGLSRVGVVGAIIPAMLTFLGGLSVYIFGIDRSKGIIASLTSACFAFSLVAAYAVGAQLRNTGDEIRDLRSHCIKAYSNPDLVANEQAMRTFEENYEAWCEAGSVWNLQ